MASLSHPTLALHLTDRTATPILTSAGTPARLDALASLTTTALASHDAALRLGLGAPQHAVIEFAGGPVQLVSFLGPPPRRRPGSASGLASADATTPGGPASPADAGPSASAGAAPGPRLLPGQVNGLAFPLSPLAGSGVLGLAGPDGDDGDAGTAPMLLALVVAPGPDELPSARRAVARLERVGTDVQAEWAAEEESREGTESGD